MLESHAAPQPRKTLANASVRRIVVGRVRGRMRDDEGGIVNESRWEVY